MNVLVTGATGFVGGHLVDRLLERGDTVTALVRSPARAAALASRGVRLVSGDLSNRVALAEAVAGQDVVYHVAGITGAANESELLHANRDGTANVARAVAGLPSPPRIVLTSSMAAGGPSRRGVPRRDNSSDQPVTMYGRSKLAGEQALTEAAPSWTVLRPPVVYGPRDRNGFLPLFRAAKFGIAPMFGDGSMEVSLIHVGDLADAIALAGITAAAEHGTYYVNHPEVTTGAGLVRLIAATMQRRVLPLALPEWVARAALTVTGQWAELFNQRTILHPDKIHEFFQEAWTGDPAAFIAATGWTPRWDLAAGLADTLASYRAAGWV